MIENILIIIAVIIFIFVFWGYWKYHIKRSEKTLKNWAKKNGYKILSYEPRQFKTGPFFSSFRTRSQPVFYVTLKDNNGKELNAWVRIGSFFFGLLSDEVQVKWEHQ